jgi:hypothetical protein
MIIPNLKYARRVLVKLINKDLVKSVQCSMPFQSRGPGLNFYALRTQASRFFDTSVREQKIPTGTHLYHFYITNTILTGFKTLSNNHQGFEVKSAAEKELRSMCHEFQQSDFSSKKTGVPDFALAIGSKDKMRLFLGEVDAKTETIINSADDSNTIANKFDDIKRTCKLGLLDKLSKYFSFEFSNFSYLIITSGDESRAIKIINDSDILVACFSDIKDSCEKLIERVWYSTKNNSVSILEEL